MRVLITGGAGFLGVHLTRAHLRRGDTVVVLDSLHPQVHPQGPPPELPRGAVLLRGDVRDEALLADATGGVELVHHLAAETGTGQSMYEVARYAETNVVGTARLLEALGGRRPPVRLVLASSRAVYGEGAGLCTRCGPVLPLPGRRREDLEAGRWHLRCPNCAGPARPQPTTETCPPAPSSMYGVTKLSQEELVRVACQAGEVTGWILRMQNLYGPGQSLHNPYTGLLVVFLGCLQRGRPCQLYEDGEIQRDLLYVEDAAAAFVAAGDRDPPGGCQVVNLGTGRAWSLRELEALLRRLHGGDAPPPEVIGAFRAGDIRHACAAPGRSEDLLGWQPATPLEAGLRNFLDWAAQQGGLAPMAALDREELRRRGLGR